jgi:hypothetical protein
VTSADGAKTATCFVSVPYPIGSTGPAGGIVFYDAGNYTTYGWRYLECAPSDQSDGLMWFDGTYRDIAGARETAIGTGKANTAAIIAAQGPTIAYAANICTNLRLGGYSDWFLPSKEELNLMFTNLYEASPSLGSFTSFRFYWSSSQDRTNYAWDHAFNSIGQQLTDDTLSGCYVRAIRAF